jgi:NAD(P)-dependent dehydrogenase (short-subunit alcohol dehydrogenase family)
MNRLTNRVAVVTGGAGGIGRAVAEALAAEGASVAIADRSAEGAQEVANAINAAGGAATWASVDVSARSDVERLVEQVTEVFGVPDIAFCSAGITTAGGEPGLLALTDDEWHRVFEVNVTGTFLTSQAIARALIQAERPGSIITVSSVGGQRPMFGVPAYHTTKAAVAGLTRAFAVNLAHHGIRVNAIAPGYISTPMLQAHLDESRERTMVSRVPMGRLGEPSDLVGAVVFLASDESSYITGQVLYIDGGAYVLGWTPSQSIDNEES